MYKYILQWMEDDNLLEINVSSEVPIHNGDSFSFPDDGYCSVYRVVHIIEKAPGNGYNVKKTYLEGELAE